MNTYQENLEAADDLLANATELLSTPRCHLAKTSAEMASAHAAIAHVQLLALLHEAPRLVLGDINVSPTGIDKLWTLPEPGEHQKRVIREREAEQLDIASKPIWERPWPHNVIKATSAYHPGTDSDLSRDEPSYFHVTGATAQVFIGNWVEGAGFIGVHADRSGCSSVPIRERLILARSTVEVI